MELDQAIIIIGNFYWSPREDFDVDIQNCLDSALQSYLQLVLGDFVAHRQLWSYNRDDASRELFVDTLLSRNLVLLNSADCLPTYESGNKEVLKDLSICIQYLFKYFDNWSVFPYLFGDRRPIVTSIKFEIPILPKRRFRTKKWQWKFYNPNLKFLLG